MSANENTNKADGRTEPATGPNKKRSVARKITLGFGLVGVLFALLALFLVHGLSNTPSPTDQTRNVFTGPGGVNGALSAPNDPSASGPGVTNQSTSTEAPASQGGPYLDGVPLTRAQESTLGIGMQDRNINPEEAVRAAFSKLFAAYDFGDPVYLRYYATPDFLKRYPPLPDSLLGKVRFTDNKLKDITIISSSPNEINFFASTALNYRQFPDKPYDLGHYKAIYNGHWILSERINPRS